jgi:polysaccharide deacetylase family protein (PEP-CTERM system associated)
VTAAKYLPQTALSFDVEEWFHASVVEKYVPRSTWQTQPSRLESQMETLMYMMASMDIKATFFCLGVVAEKHAGILRQLVASGHEVASHGISHRNLYDLSRNDLQREIADSKKMLEDCIGSPVNGFRAPNFSITDVALDVMLKAGYTYDSSVFDVEWHPNYGRLRNFPMRSDAPYKLIDDLWEVPLTVNPVMGFKVPWSGGAYLRHFPFGTFRRGLLKQAKKGYAQIYLHPWEIDQGQPLPENMSKTDKRRHAGGIAKVAQRLDILSKSVAFCTIDDVLKQHKPT